MFLGRRAALASAGAFVLAPGAASAQDFPRGPIRMVIAFPPGGPTDVVARVMAHHISEILG